MLRSSATQFCYPATPLRHAWNVSAIDDLHVGDEAGSSGVALVVVDVLQGVVCELKRPRANIHLEDQRVPALVLHELAIPTDAFQRAVTDAQLVKCAIDGDVVPKRHKVVVVGLTLRLSRDGGILCGACRVGASL